MLGADGIKECMPRSHIWRQGFWMNRKKTGRGKCIDARGSLVGCRASDDDDDEGANDLKLCCRALKFTKNYGTRITYLCVCKND